MKLIDFLTEGLLTELFDTEVQGVSFIPARKVRDMSTGPGRHTKYACVFDVRGRLYVAYLTQPPDFSTGSYMLGFGLFSEEKDGLEHAIVNQQIPVIEVYNKVVKAAMMMFARARPRTVAMVGHTKRQNELYPRLLKKLENRIPGYEADAQNMIIHKVSPRKNRAS